MSTKNLDENEHKTQFETDEKDSKQDDITQEKNEDNIKEQPSQNLKAHTATAEDEEDNNGASNFDEGSLLGKFKTTESLMNAYDNLQKEFTRKSQKLSELNKQVAELKENANKQNAPSYEAKDWDKKVQTFFETNPNAKEYVNEISELILKDKTVANSTESLDIAWAKVLNNKFTSPEKLAKDEQFVSKYILNNKEVTQQIIKNYLQGLSSKKTAPVISAHSGSGFSLAPKNKPNNLEEAKKMAESFFKI